MEICSVFGSGFHHTLTSPSPSAAASSSSAVPLSSTTIRAINNFDFTATVTSTTIAPLKLDETHKGPTKSSPNLRTVFRKTKQSAIFYIQESSDLESALSRLLIHLFLMFFVWLNWFLVLFYCFHFFGLNWISFPHYMLGICLIIFVLLLSLHCQFTFKIGV